VITSWNGSNSAHVPSLSIVTAICDDSRSHIGIFKSTWWLTQHSTGNTASVSRDLPRSLSNSVWSSPLLHLTQICRSFTFSSFSFLKFRHADKINYPTSLWSTHHIVPWQCKSGFKLNSTNTEVPSLSRCQSF
jgi:hypothetical protein